jgi:hypothetical protein
LGWLGSPQLKLQRKRCLGAHEAPTLSSLVGREKTDKWKNRERELRGPNWEDEECDGNVETPPCPNANFLACDVSAVRSQLGNPNQPKTMCIRVQIEI